MNLERGFLTNTSKKGRAKLDYFSKVKRRVNRVGTNVSEKIVLIFVAKYHESVIPTAAIHLWLESDLKKFRVMVANQNIGKDWFKK